ncbi:MAG: WecB/TagA/CpsF family glycosyltransferase [Burkholderiales bacterium]|nr:WecB/TagA/CpsF family glycosyltransferase [Bacteroidia bacterium]
MLLNSFNIFTTSLNSLEDKKLLISTLNAHSFNLAQENKIFAKALQQSDVLLPDGISIVLAKGFLDGTQLKKIAGADLFAYEMQRLNNSHGSCLFLGSSEHTLQLIKTKANIEYPQVTVQTYSPPYKEQLSEEDNAQMIEAVNRLQPDVLFIGMTAPKQELWAHEHFRKLTTKHVCCIGAVFDFYAGTVKRAPNWMIKFGLEWLYRFLSEPKRLWKRYLIGNFKFIYFILKEKCFS